MKCAKCYNPTTVVVNTRSRTKSPVIWRRRRCLSCDSVFSTEERPTLEHSLTVWNPTTKQSQAFNPGILLISIGDAFQHNLTLGENSAWSLTQTISDLLATECQGSISTDDISAITHQTLMRFDASASLQYALKHQLMASSK